MVRLCGVEGHPNCLDETLWQACMERITFLIKIDEIPTIAVIDAFERAIHAMSTAELKLYDISSEAEK